MLEKEQLIQKMSQSVSYKKLAGAKKMLWNIFNALKNFGRGVFLRFVY